MVKHLYSECHFPTDDEYGALQKAARPQAPMQQNPIQAGSGKKREFACLQKVEND